MFNQGINMITIKPLNFKPLKSAFYFQNSCHNGGFKSFCLNSTPSDSPDVIPVEAGSDNNQGRGRNAGGGSGNRQSDGQTRGRQNNQAAGMPNQVQNNGGSNFVYNPVNASGKLVTGKLTNTFLLTNPKIDAEQEVIEIPLKMNIQINRLNKQAQVFASKVIGITTFKHDDILGRDTRFWEKQLQEMFIYSYAKAVLGGFKDYSNQQIPTDEYLLCGHAILFHCLRKRVVTMSFDDVFVTYNFIHSNQEMEIIKKIFDQYDFIQEKLVFEQNNYVLNNKIIERMITQYAKGMKAGTNRDFPFFVNIRRELSKLENLVSKVHLPVANSFYDQSRSKWYYAFDKDVRMNGCTLLFGKAHHLSIATTVEENVLKYFEEIQSDYDTLVKYEVECMAASKYYDVPGEVKDLPKGSV